MPRVHHPVPAVSMQTVCLIILCRDFLTGFRKRKQQRRKDAHRCAASSAHKSNAGSRCHGNALCVC